MTMTRLPDTRELPDQMRTLVTLAFVAGLEDAADWMLDNYFDKRSDYVLPGPTNKG